MIRLKYKSKLSRLLGVGRFAAAKLYYGRRLSGSWFNVVDCRCTLAIESPSSTIKMGKKCLIGSDCTIYSSGTLAIGSNCFFNSHTRIDCHERIDIGSNCLFGPFSSILDYNHKVDFYDGILRREEFETAPVRIGDNVWIGEKAIVLMGVTIGDNSVIGAGAVVTKSVPANSIAVGVPARIFRSLEKR